VNEARDALLEVYDRHVEDEMNYGEGRNRDMCICVPMWVVELLVLE